MSTLAPKKTVARPQFAPTLRVYLRQSIGEDRNTHGIAAQRGICQQRARADALAWESRAEYVDVGFSRDDLNRPEYLRLLKEASAGDTILIWERSRLGVDLDYVIAVRQLTKQCGARILVASGDPIDASETGLVMEHMRGNQDGGELRRIRTRTREKLRERVLKGYIAGPLPYGLESYAEHPADPSSWKLGRKVPAEEAIIIRMATMRADGVSWVRVARALNRDGVPSPGGGKWCRAHVWEILVEQVAVYRDGIYTFGARGGKGGKFPPVSYTHPEWRMGDANLWARLEATNAARTVDMRARMANGAKHALSGSGRCAACGGGLMVLSDGRVGKRVNSYTCSRNRRHRGETCEARFRIRAELLEGKVKEALEPWFDATRAAIRGAVRDVQARIAAAGAPDVAAIEAELAAARTGYRRLQRVATMVDDPLPETIADMKAAADAVRQLEAALARAQAPRADARQIGKEIEREAVQRLDALRVALTGPNARDALHALFPQGLQLRLTEDSYVLEADGVLTIVRQPDGVRTEVRTPFAVSIPRAKAA